MRKALLLLLTVLVLFTSCNPDSQTSVIYDKLHASPSVSYRIFQYVGDYDDSRIVIATDEGLKLYNVSSLQVDKVLTSPITRPLFIVEAAGSKYVVYYRQNTDEIYSSSNPNQYLFALNLTGSINNGNETVIGATISIDGTQQDLTNIYSVPTQTGNSVTSIAYTVQAAYEAPQDTENRVQTFYHFSSSNVSASINSEGKLEIIVTGATKATARSSASIAPYICGDGYLAYINKDQSIYRIYQMGGSEVEGYSVNYGNDNNLVATGSSTYIISYYNPNYGGREILIDSNGVLYHRAATGARPYDTSWEYSRDYGSFPLDDRRAAYTTIINNTLFIVYKHGPDVVSFDQSGALRDNYNTGRINDQEIVGVKYFDNQYCFITQESAIRKTTL